MSAQNDSSGVNTLLLVVIVVILVAAGVWFFQGSEDVVPETNDATINVTLPEMGEASQ